MKHLIALLVMASVLGGCHTVQSMKGQTSKERMATGLKKDADATGAAIERSAHEVGTALGQALKRGGEKLEEVSK